MDKDKNFELVFEISMPIFFVAVVFLISDRFSEGIPFFVMCTIVSATFMIWAAVMSIKIDKYFKSEDFGHLKKKLEKYTQDINDFNDHIEQLKQSYVENYTHKKFGYSDLESGGWNFKRPGWQSLDDARNVHQCSLQIVKNSKVQPFKYLCKYFGFKEDEATLEEIEEILNDFSAAEQGKELIIRKREELLDTTSGQIPSFIEKYAQMRFFSELGIKTISLDKSYFPKFIFRYISAGGNSQAQNIITMNPRNLDEFIGYLSSCIEWRKTVAGQRALMTSALRKEILERDHYTCKKCGASIEEEPNLLLEIDHIIPISRGGITSVENLQTLCWRCNRSKGSKIQNQE